ncbi:MAG: hypothetical protein L0I24_06480 [Pseudonocardia sp.]|nr:hypothetical protein [Pseudonocardia sp.]
MPADQGAFDAAYAAVLAASRESLDLGAGEPVPDGEPFELTRTKAGL